jgi:hypothetical protein
MNDQASAEGHAGPTAVLLLVGLALLALGVLMATKPKVAEWGLTHGRGRIWAKLLGMEKAMKLTRFFFGPLVAVLGLCAMLAGLFT